MNALLLHCLSLVALTAYCIATFAYAKSLNMKSDVLSSRLHPSRVLFLGVVCHFCFIAATEFHSLSVPNYPRTISFVSLSLVGLFLLLERPLKIYSLGAFVAPVGLVLFVMSSVAFHLGTESPGVSEGNVMLTLHLLSTVFSYVFLFITGSVSAALLMSERALKRKELLRNTVMFPPIVFLDRFYRIFLLLGATLLVFGILTGVLASHLLGMQWAVMFAKLVWILPELVVYSMLLVMVYGFGYRGRRLSLVTIVGAFVVAGSLLAAMGTSGGFHAN